MDVWLGLLGPGAGRNAAGAVTRELQEDETRTLNDDEGLIFLRLTRHLAGLRRAAGSTTSRIQESA